MTQKIVIFGPYKSGTTGLFYKIRNSLPRNLNLRTLFEQNEYLPEDEDSKRWVLAKTIIGVQDGPDQTKLDSFMGFDKKIYIARDPRDLVISATLFIIQQEPTLYKNDDKLIQILGTLRQKERRPESVALNAIMKQVFGASNNHTFEGTIDWLARQYRWLPEFENQLEDYFLIRYEDFVDGQIEGLERYLGTPLKGEANVDEPHNHVPRTMGYNNWKDWFLKEDIAFFKPLFDQYIRRYGYATDWKLNERQTISPEHCSKYVERTVGKKRKMEFL